MIALRPSRSVARVACLVLSLGLPCELSTLRAYGAGDKRIAPGALAEIQALEQEKAARTPAEQKLDSNLLYAHKKLVTGVASAAVPHLEPSVKIRPDGLVEVDVSASVSADLLGFITNSGGQIINSFPQYQTIRAAIPLSAVEAIAARPDVRFVDRAQEARHNFTDAEGDFCHQGALARGNFGVDGTGIKVGVLSDSDTYLTNAQAAGDLGPVTTLPGQAGPTTGEQGDGEGTAMMDVVHRIAPGAQLYFATGDPSQAQMASNILALAAAGCRIIVDDISYGGEFPFQESLPIAQAVQTVSDQGVLYFSSAANNGNEDSGTSGTWEGDFADGGAVGSPITGTGKGGGFESGRVHNFSGGTNYDFITSTGSQNGIDLWWSDAWGSSSNDYDVFVLNSTGTSVLAFSNSSQPGSPYPWEPVPANANTSFDNGELIVVVKYSGAARFLHLSAGPHFQLAFNTPGNTHGHNSSSAANAFCVAATPAYLAQEFGDPSGPYPNNPFTGGAANRVETFTSDGPRRIFYYPDGTPITPGNFSSTGGLLLQKPDITAADGVTTTAALGGNFNLFFGTSCAAPHAAAIAALLLSYNPSLNPAQVRSLLTSTALDIMATGWDRDSGYGIVMPEPALAVSPAPPPVISIINPASAIVGTPIVIYGANFATTTNVQFNGVAAQFVSLSNSVIVVTAIPAAATTGPLRIATRWGVTSAMFNVLPTPAPSNDNFANATILSGTAAMVSGTTAGATKEPGEPNHAGNAGGKSIWYSWTAPEAGTITLDTVGSSFNTLLAVYTGNAVNALTPIASNVGSGSNGTSALTFSAILGTTYRIAIDGVGGASGSVVLRLLPAQTTIYATGFEPSDGFSTAFTLNGQNGWTNGGVGTGANGIVTNFFPGLGQQAFVGFSSPVPAINTAVYRPFNFNIDTNTRPIIQFSVNMDVVQSTDGFYDNFWWIVANGTGHALFGFKFIDGSPVVESCYYSLDTGSAVYATDYSLNSINTLTFTMDFGQNEWLATFDGIPQFFTPEPITTTGAALTLGAIEALWTISNANAPGNNFMLFDNYSVTASPRAGAKILLGPQNRTVTTGNTIVLLAAATGTAPVTYQWSYNGNAIANATNASYTLSIPLPAQSGTYSVSAVNATGNDTASAVVTITNPPPHAVFGNASFSGTNGLVLNLNVANGNRYRLLASTNLSDWTTLAAFYANSTNTLCVDSSVTNYPRRFYQVVSP